MAYDQRSEVAERFRALVEPWLAEQRPGAKDYAQLHFALDGLQYRLAADRAPARIAPPQVAHDAHCSAPGCASTWRTPDACLLLLGGRWLCRAHHPPFAGLPPPGWTPPAAQSEQQALLVEAAWGKLTPAERAAINRNIVTVASAE